MENLWANSDYGNDYLCYLEQMLDEGFDAANMQPRIDELADLIRADVYADGNKMYSTDEFEQNLYTDIQDGMDTIYGLLNFVQQRSAFMNTHLSGLSLDCPDTPSILVGTLFINEFMADNDTTIEDPDEPGAYEDWLEIYNAGGTTIGLGGMYLSDDAAEPTQWQIPSGVTVDPGACLLFWADDDDEQGDTHTNFKLSADGEFIGLYESDGNSNVAIDWVAFGPQATDVSFGRCPDGGSNWSTTTPATPGTTNSCRMVVFIDGFETGDTSAWSVAIQ